MPSSEILKLGVLLPLLISACNVAPFSSTSSSTSSSIPPPRLGQPLAETQLTRFDYIIEPDGAGLPPGSGNAMQGRIVFNNRCQACHGAEGEGANPGLRLAGGDMHSVEPPIRTVGSFWPHATTVFDYIRRAMPADAPKSLSDDEVYQVTAYVLFLSGIIGETETLDSQSLPAVQMPNRDGFIDNSNIQ
ncbi:MAG: cytochrome c [Pseudohongiellaceae bacterium]